jgi:hypothetical protein
VRAFLSPFLRLSFLLLLAVFYILQKTVGFLFSLLLLLPHLALLFSFEFTSLLLTSFFLLLLATVKIKQFLLDELI